MDLQDSCYKSVVQIDEFDILVTRKRIKTMRLTVHPAQGKICASVPFHYPDFFVVKALGEKRDWIKKQLCHNSDQPDTKTPLLLDGDTVPYLGRSLRLKVTESEKKPTIDVSGMELIMATRAHSQSRTDISRRAHVIEQWYRQQLKALIPDLLTKWQPVIGREVSEWGIKKMRIRWGSCNIAAKRIWLALDLIKYPKACIEYVLVHELVHLHERYHNKNFIRLMDLYYPHWREQEKLLNRNR